MSEARGGLEKVLTATLLLLMGFLILQALGYGIGFFFDPASGTGEFATPPAAPDDPLTVALVGEVGVGMLGTAALLGLAAWFIVKANPAGTSIAMLVGIVYCLAGLSAHRASWGWDAYFYGGTGALLFVLACSVRWARSKASPGVSL